MHFIISFVLALAATTVVSMPSPKTRPEIAPTLHLIRSADGSHMLTRQADSSSQPSFSPNVAGAILNATAVTNVSASFTISPLSVFGDGNEADAFGVAIIVGIDALYCPNAGAMAGIESIVENGEASYSAFITAFPQGPVAVPGFNLSAGDNIAISITVTNATSATVVLTNESTNQTVTEVTPTGTLCMQEADWIIEDMESDGSLPPLADFSSVNFTDVSAATSSGPLDITGATIFNMEQNNTVLTSVSALPSEIDIVFV
ncbi:uncharacterized protein PHACADRAFT_214362 [Phanerochaete carnosa HHB-10118-sp]|uniref:Uncharacterized protein n=1 Tax=Phanerochaete carnosa (strain HHB-10118-sp) TaxID=650164 RepID=K5UJW6_PHACS|nr:uncharacterized protein PHACADRAFT_214362 [Phanerochaete carnosa HHB-10118-sp]EKM49841.1 hypothetical protein PHACADRAFT_214362 [Phanerochaete carnosa HHB-10118-sp]